MTIDAGGADKWDSAEGFKDAYGDEWLKREVVRGASDAESYVLHREAALSYETRHEAYGSYYVPGVSPVYLDSFYEASSGYEPGKPFTLAFDTSMAADSERYGAILALPELAVRAGAKTLVLDRTAGFSFGFNSRTGVFSGSARFSFDGGRAVVGTFRGVLAPGWVLPCECGIVAPERPFGHGALIFRDIVNGRSAARSIPAILDKVKSP